MLYGREHVERYRATDGEEGHIWRKGSTVALLTTIGRKSGEERTMPLIYGRTNGGFMVVASDGGSDEHPAWYLNLKANPAAELQVLSDRFKVQARDATAEERPELWKRMTAQWPDYDDYQKRTDREIPVVILERVD
jgi:deazaflavin-dependent oxidoreductase (nitroreductase family)